MLSDFAIKLRDEAAAQGKRNALNVGCGIDYRQFDEEYIWTNIDANPEVKSDYRCDIYRLDEHFAEFAHFIEARDILEHIPVDWSSPYEWRKALKSWANSLALDGVLRVQVPEPYSMYKLLESGEIDEEDYNRRIFGERWSPYEIHYQMFSAGRLRRELINAGLKTEKHQIINGNVIMIARRVK